MIAQLFEMAPPESIPLTEYFRFRAQTPIRSRCAARISSLPRSQQFQHMTFLYQSLYRLLLVFHHLR
jgi:hypothetical protein